MSKIIAALLISGSLIAPAFAQSTLPENSNGLGKCASAVAKENKVARKEAKAAGEEFINVPPGSACAPTDPV